VKALVQMLTNGDGTQFVATTEADADGRFWWFTWGDDVLQPLMEYDTEEGCNEHFINWIENQLAGWRCDGIPVVVPAPDAEEHEMLDVWAQRAIAAIEALVLSHHLVEAGAL